MEQLIFSLPDFINDNKFPIEYTGRGKDSSPEIAIGNLSDDAETLAVTLEDISHPIKNFTHWIIWNIPAAGKIEKAIPKGKYRRDTRRSIRYAQICRSETASRQDTYISHNGLCVRLPDRLIR